jgi:hypothetical protein
MGEIEQSNSLSALVGHTFATTPWPMITTLSAGLSSYLMIANSLARIRSQLSFYTNWGSAALES